jgi:NAD(P)-dependent dehydrogenase (short-subunit alcohol dehydrogenase family)
LHGGRLLRPRILFSELVAYLVSGAAGFVTGQNFVVDGGMTKKMIYV